MKKWQIDLAVGFLEREAKFTSDQGREAARRAAHGGQDSEYWREVAERCADRASALEAAAKKVRGK